MIQISEPGIEALIQQRLETGPFSNIEEVLRQALTDAPLPLTRSTKTGAGETGAILWEALRKCPFPEVDLEPERFVMPISDPVQF